MLSIALTATALRSLIRTSLDGSNFQNYDIELKKDFKRFHSNMQPFLCVQATWPRSWRCLVRWSCACTPPRPSSSACAFRICSSAPSTCPSLPAGESAFTFFSFTFFSSKNRLKRMLKKYYHRICLRRVYEVVKRSPRSLSRTGL